jgi:hypothetical protein
MGDDQTITKAANTLRRIEAWACYIEGDDADPWLQGYETAHLELMEYLRELGVPKLIVKLTGNQPTVPGAKLDRT